MKKQNEEKEKDSKNQQEPTGDVLHIRPKKKMKEKDYAEFSHQSLSCH